MITIRTSGCLLGRTQGRFAPSGRILPTIALAGLLAAGAAISGAAPDVVDANAGASPLDSNHANAIAIPPQAGESILKVDGSPAARNGPGAFRPATSLRDSLRHHRNLIADDIWWTVTGDEMAWMHKNAHQLFPTVNVYRNGPVKMLQSEPLEAIARFPVTTPDGAMPFEEFLASPQSTAMGVVVLHHGKIVFERYPRMEDFEKPIYWSVAKVLPATLIGILEARGEIDVSRPVEAYLTELAESEFAGISVRNLLDMASGLDCEDDYDDRQSCYYQYSMAIGDGFRDANAPDNPYDFLGGLKVTRHAGQGERFSYSGVNTFIAAWLVEKLTGYPFQDVFTREIWWELGAEADASFIAYRYGIPLTHGGFLAKPRDLARFGLLFTPSYRVVSSRKIVSDDHIDLLRFGSNPALREYAGAAGVFTSATASPDDAPGSQIQAADSPAERAADKPANQNVDTQANQTVDTQANQTADTQANQTADTQAKQAAGTPAKEERPYTHSIYQWDYVHPDGTLLKGGWGGQGLIVNPDRDLVVVFASYFKDDQNSEADLGEAIFEVLNGVYGMALPLEAP